MKNDFIVFFILAALFAFLFPGTSHAIGPITAKNAAQIADHVNKMSHKNVYDQIAEEAKLGGYYTIFDGRCSDLKMLKGAGYSLLQNTTISGRLSCSVSW